MEESRDDKNGESTRCMKEGLLTITWDPPTLQSIASVTFVAKKLTDIMLELPSRFIEMNDFEKGSELLDLEIRSTNKITENIPNLLQSIVSPFIQPISEEFFKWLRSDFCEVFFFNDVCEVGSAIYWRMEGTIDYVKTLKELINSGKTVKDYYKLYELACMYCLEEYIIDLLDKIPFEEKHKLDFIYERLFLSEVDYFSFSPNKCPIHMLMYWTFTVRNEWHIMLRILHNSTNSMPFRLETNHDFGDLKVFVLYSIQDSNEIAFKYFWQKIVNEENNIINDLWLEQFALETISEISITYLMDFTFYEYILKFMLSYMREPSKQKYIARIHSRNFLLSLFDYRSFRRLFKPSLLLPFMLNNISEDNYANVMYDLSKRVEYQKLGDVFEEVWSASLLDLKQMFLERSSCDFVFSLLLSLMKTGHLKTALSVIRDISATYKEHILHFMIGNRDIIDYIENTIGLDSLDALFVELTQ